MPEGSAPGFKSHPGYKVTCHQSPKRVRTAVAGIVIADSRRVQIVRETRHTPVYYFPPDDVRISEFLTPVDHATHCPFKGQARYWNVTVGERVIENAVWAYEDPWDECQAIKGYMAFYWNKMDVWFEDDEQVHIHARDPFIRIDVLLNRIPIRVVHGGEVLAESSSYLALYETGLVPRYYIPQDDVSMSKLQPSETKTQCPYKGTASYFSGPGEDGADLIWTYPDPLAEVIRIKDHLCFYQERTDLIEIVGQPIPKPKSHWAPI